MSDKCRICGEEKDLNITEIGELCAICYKLWRKIQRCRKITEMFEKVLKDRRK